MLTLWLVTVLAKAVLCALLWFKRQQRKYPYFVAWITYQLAESAVLLTLGQRGAAYFYAYWVMAAVDVLFKVAVLLELFHDVYQSELIERVIVRRFYVLTALLAGISFALATAFRSHHPVQLMAAIHTADAGACLMLCLTFIAILVGARIEGVYWLNRSLGIGYGLLLYLPLRALIDVIELPAHRAVIVRLNYAEMGAFLGAVLIWITFFIRPEIQRFAVPLDTLTGYADDLEGLRR